MGRSPFWPPVHKEVMKNQCSQLSWSALTINTQEMVEDEYPPHLVSQFGLKIWASGMFCIHLLQQADTNCMKLTGGCDLDLQVKCQHDAAIFTRKVNNEKRLLHSRSNMKTMPTFSLTAEVWCNYEIILRSANREI